MTNSLTSKLQGFADLSAADCSALAAFPDDVRDVPAGIDLIVQGNRPDFVYLLLEGWACRYKLMPDGHRQIVAYLIPGDLTAAQVLVIRRTDHSLGVLGPAKVAMIPFELMLGTINTHPRIARALRWTALVDEATLREWIVNVGRRGPYERVAHLLCEMWVRMGNVGMVTAGRFSLPLTQAEIGETVALTPVTVNRVLQRLRRAGLITLRDGTLSILDVEQLISVGEFDRTYLQGEDATSRAGSAYTQ